MKKLALIMLAVVSMALVSCGGGGLKPAERAFVYADYGQGCGEIYEEVDEDSGETTRYQRINRGASNDGLKDCWKIINAAVTRPKSSIINVTLDLEVVKDIVFPECQGDYLSFRPSGCIELLDKKGAVLCSAKEQVYLPTKKGDVKSVTSEIEFDYKDGNVNGQIDIVLKNAKCVRFKGVRFEAFYMSSNGGWSNADYWHRNEVEIPQ